MLGFQASGARPSWTGIPWLTPRPWRPHQDRQSASWKAHGGFGGVGRADRQGHGRRVVEAYKTLARTEGILLNPHPPPRWPEVAKLLRKAT
jgi:hypothetical protein